MMKDQFMALAAVAVLMASGTATAEVSLGGSNDPSALMNVQFASLMGVEKTTLKAVPKQRLQEMVVGPKVKVETTVAPVLAKTEPAKKISVDPSGIYTEEALMAMPEPKGDEEWQCMKTALYFEARGESLKGQFAVAEVILNRVDSPAYPNTICGVVNQRAGGSCQFSYACDGSSEVMHETYAAEIAGRIARFMMDSAERPLTAGATHFHTRAVRPNWSVVFPQTAAIGAHLFYRRH